MLLLQSLPPTIISPPSARHLASLDEANNETSLFAHQLTAILKPLIDAQRDLGQGCRQLHTLTRVARIETVDILVSSAWDLRRTETMTHGASRTPRCKVMDCNEKHVHQTLPNGVRIYSSFCQEHTCMAPRNEHTGFCINPRGAGNRYCHHHGKCRARGCTQQASRTEREPFPYICAQHRCRFCMQPRFGQFDVCEAHLTCQVRGCRNHPDLKHPRLLCNSHSCTISNQPCQHPAVGAVGSKGHCAHHLPCEAFRGCTRVCIRLPDGRHLRHCEEHVPCARAPQGCRQLAQPRTPFCYAHKCSLELCPREKYTAARSIYCQQHTCGTQNCHQPVSRINDAGSRFCSAHECIQEGCAAPSKQISGLCENHGCTHNGCNALRRPGSTFCGDHKCRSCSYEATHKNGYCRSHACIETGCKQPRVGGENHIKQCLDHWAKDIRKDAARKVGHAADREREALEEQLEKLRIHEEIRQARESRDRERARQDEWLAEERRRALDEAEMRRLEEESHRLAEQERIEELVAQGIEEREREREEQEAREIRRAERERQRREEEVARVAREREQARRDREQREWEAAQHQRALDEARREREARDRLRERMRREPRRGTEYHYSPSSDASRRGTRRDSFWDSGNW